MQREVFFARLQIAKRQKPWIIRGFLDGHYQWDTIKTLFSNSVLSLAHRGVSLSNQGSVTHWIEQLKEGEPEAAQQVWERYWARLIGLARTRLGGNAGRMADAEDAAQSAMQTFFRRAHKGNYPLLNDRQELWQLLVVITASKASNQRRRERALKRGGGKVRGDSVFGQDGPGIEQVISNEPTPAFAAAVAEEHELLFKKLDDESGSESLRVIAQMKFEGYSVKEIAEHLDCSERTVKRKLALIRSIWTAEINNDAA